MIAILNVFIFLFCNACDDPSNVKKQAKVDLYHFVTTKLQALYA